MCSNFPIATEFVISWNGMTTVIWKFRIWKTRANRSRRLQDSLRNLAIPFGWRSIKRPILRAQSLLAEGLSTINSPRDGHNLWKNGKHNYSNENTENTENSSKYWKHLKTHKTIWNLKDEQLKTLKKDARQKNHSARLETINLVYAMPDVKGDGVREPALQACVLALACVLRQLPPGRSSPRIVEQHKRARRHRDRFARWIARESPPRKSHTAR